MTRPPYKTDPLIKLIPASSSDPGISLLQTDVLSKELLPGLGN